MAEESLAILPVEVCEEAVYRQHLAAARRYVSDRDPDDAPLAALAIAFGIPIWSHDEDFRETPLEVYTTARIIKILGV